MRSDPLKLRPQSPLTVLLEHLDLTATQAELWLVQKAWRDGQALGDIAQQLQRDPDEVALMVMHLARQNQIGNRPGGAFGTS